MMHWQPLFAFFQANGVDPSTLQPLPMQGPPLITPQMQWIEQKRLNRADKYLRKAEQGAGQRVIDKAKSYLYRAR